jgi:hypothetical protein
MTHSVVILTIAVAYKMCYTFAMTFANRRMLFFTHAVLSRLFATTRC